MSDHPPPKRVYCRRNKISKEAGEHLACPYCFGKKKETIEEGDREHFCDYDPEQDPISFGFPDDSTRNLHG